MTRFITLAGNIRICEAEYLAALLTDCSKNNPPNYTCSLASALLAVISEYASDSVYDFQGYIKAKKILSCRLDVDMCEVSRLCIIARQVKRFFDANEGKLVDVTMDKLKTPHTMTVRQLVSGLLSLPNQNAFVCFYAPESPCPIKSVHAPNYDTSHVYLDYKA